jgi:hypothetical protein
MDDDVVVEPTEREQILRIRHAAFGIWSFVMDFHPVTAVASVNGAAATGSAQDGPA